MVGGGRHPNHGHQDMLALTTLLIQEMMPSFPPVNCFVLIANMKNEKKEQCNCIGVGEFSPHHISSHNTEHFILNPATTQTLAKTLTLPQPLTPTLLWQ